MTHRTHEEIERMIAHPEIVLEPGCRCADCVRRLEEARAVRHRLREAFGAVRAEARLEDRVLAAIRSGGREKAGTGKAWRLRRVVPSVAAVAALVLVTAVLTLIVSGNREAQAAPGELASIHQTNLMPHAALQGSADPEKVAAYLKKELDFVPALPRLGSGRALRGCCVAYFRNRPVGTYVVDTDRGVISVIVLTDAPESLGMSGRTRLDGRDYYAGAFARNKMAATRIGDLTYCAVGETETEWLVELLNSLLTGQAKGEAR